MAEAEPMSPLEMIIAGVKVSDLLLYGVVASLLRTRTVFGKKIIVAMLQ